MTDKTEIDLAEISMRLVADDDHASVRELFRAGLIEGLVPENDTGADMENITEAYFSDEGYSALWVADYEQTVIGMVGVQKTSEHGAEVRRLRVHSDYRRKGVGAKLMEQALTFCRHHGYLKVTLDVRIERGPAIALFEKFGFQLNRTREINGRRMLDFYVDLYREPSA